MRGSFKRFFQALILSLAWQIPRGRDIYGTKTATLARESTPREKQRHRERRQRLKRAVPPRYLVQRGGYAGSHSKDRRFSNQRLLRRMYRNH